MKQLKHPNLANIIEIIAPKNLENYNCIYVVTEFCKGDLKKIMKSNHIFFTIDHIKLITLQILKV